MAKGLVAIIDSSDTNLLKSSIGHDLKECNLKVDYFKHFSQANFAFEHTNYGAIIVGFSLGPLKEKDTLYNALKSKKNALGKESAAAEDALDLIRKTRKSPLNHKSRVIATCIAHPSSDKLHSRTRKVFMKAGADKYVELLEEHWRYEVIEQVEKVYGKLHIFA